jgi:hypothetical protein
LSASSIPDAQRSPSDISTLTPFNYSRVYFLFDSVDATRAIDSVTIHAPSGSTTHSVVVPVIRLEKKDTTIHKLAARSLLEDLERGHSPIHLGPNKPYPGSWDETNRVRKAAEEIACKWSLVSKWTSFFLVEEPYVPAADDPFTDGVIEVRETPGDDLLRPRGNAEDFAAIEAASVEVSLEMAEETESPQGENAVFRFGTVVRRTAASKKLLVSPALGASGAEAARRAHSAYQERFSDEDEKRRSRSRSRPAHSKLKTALGIAAIALAATGAAKYLQSNKIEKEEMTRGRALHRDSDRERSPSRKRSKSRAASLAKAGLGTAAVARLVQHYRHKSKSRDGKSRSRSRLRTGADVLAAGLAGAGAKKLYDRRKDKKEAEYEHDRERERDLSDDGYFDRDARDYNRRSRSRSLTRSGPTYPDVDSSVADPELGVVEYGAYIMDSASSSRNSRLNQIREQWGQPNLDGDDVLTPRKRRSRANSFEGSINRSNSIGPQAHFYQSSTPSHGALGPAAPPTGEPSLALGLNPEQAPSLAEAAFIRHLLTFQQYNGSFVFPTPADAASCLGKPITATLSARFLKTQPPWDVAWVHTTAVVHLLERDFGSCRALWAMMAWKAEQWLANNRPPTPEASSQAGTLWSSISDLPGPLHSMGDKDAPEAKAEESGACVDESNAIQVDDEAAAAAESAPRELVEWAPSD